MARRPTVDTSTPEYRRYRRRLNTLLADEDYGPKLVRLSAADQQKVLGLVFTGRGREARALVIRLDHDRRDREREMAISTLRRRAAQHLYEVTAPVTHPSQRRLREIKGRFVQATRAQCTEVLDMALPQIQAEARNQNEGNVTWYK